MAHLKDTIIDGTLTLDDGKGDPLQDVEQFIKDLENRIALLEKSYGLVAGCEGIIIKTGTVVKNLSSTSSKLFTLDEVNEILGLETSGTIGKYMVTIMNGDGVANSTHFQSCTFLDGSFYAVFPSTQSNVRSRINWCIIYNPAFITLS